jgi:hypothetical protein
MTKSLLLLLPFLLISCSGGFPLVSFSVGVPVDGLGIVTTRIVTDFGDFVKVEARAESGSVRELIEHVGGTMGMSAEFGTGFAFVEGDARYEIAVQTSPPAISFTMDKRRWDGRQGSQADGFSVYHLAAH